jgi:hypothetical protein
LVGGGHCVLDFIYSSLAACGESPDTCL